jgi:hypothetical protein
MMMIRGTIALLLPAIAVAQSFVGDWHGQAGDVRQLVEFQKD